MPIAELLRRMDKRDESKLQPYLKDKLDFYVAKARYKKNDGRLRASDIEWICLREELIAKTLQVSRLDEIDSERSVMMDFGTAIGKVAANEWLGPMGILVGIWCCRRCGLRTIPDVQMPSKCDHCEKKGRRGVFEYEEEYLKDEVNWISGKPDGDILLPNNEIGTLEIKSIAGDKIDELAVPWPGHIWQLHTYMYLQRLNGKKRTKGVILYIAKTVRPRNTFRSSPSAFKEFIVEENPEITKALLGKAKESKRRFLAAEKFLMVSKTYDSLDPEKVLELWPRRTKCPNKSFWRARRCPVKNLCFKFDVKE